MVGVFPYRKRLASLLAASVLWSCAAIAGDLPATAEGAARLTETFKTYFGAEPSVTPEGSAYRVRFTFAPPAGMAGGMGMTLDPVKVDFGLFAQEDGSWRLEWQDLPEITARGTTAQGPVQETIRWDGFRQVLVYDPSIAGVRTGEFSADKATVALKAPDVAQDIEIDGLKGALASAGGPDETLAGEAKETFGGFKFKLVADPKTADKANGPFAVTGRGGAVTADLKFQGVKSRALVDLWAFMAAHPARSDLAANADRFKALMTAAIGGEPAFSTDYQGEDVAFDSTRGGVEFQKAGGGVGLAMKGSLFEERVSLSGVSLSEGLVPQIYKPFVPSSIDLGVRITGFDLSAAAHEAIGDFKLDGDGPWLGKDENDRVSAKLMSGGPLTIELQPSHLVAPALDLTVDGRAEYGADNKPAGKARIRIRDFDKTIEALKALGPDAEAKFVPVLAMAKGLAKKDGDALLWVCEIGADRMIKVNGLPLGKAPL